MLVKIKIGQTTRKQILQTLLLEPKNNKNKEDLLAQLARQNCKSYYAKLVKKKNRIFLLPTRLSTSSENAVDFYDARPTFADLAIEDSQQAPFNTDQTKIEKFGILQIDQLLERASSDKGLEIMENPNLLISVNANETGDGEKRSVLPKLTEGDNVIQWLKSITVLLKFSSQSNIEKISLVCAALPTSKLITATTILSENESIQLSDFLTSLKAEFSSSKEDINRAIEDITINRGDSMLVKYLQIKDHYAEIEQYSAQTTRELAIHTLRGKLPRAVTSNTVYQTTKMPSTSSDKKDSELQIYLDLLSRILDTTTPSANALQDKNPSKRYSRGSQYRNTSRRRDYGDRRRSYSRGRSNSWQNRGRDSSKRRNSSNRSQSSNRYSGRDSRGSSRSATPRRVRFERDNLCWHCNKPGHIKRNCRKLTRDREGERR